MMNKDFFKGCAHALVYYTLGAALALLAHLLFEDTYVLERGSRLYHLIIVITLFGGLFWGLYAAYKYFKGFQKSYYQGLVSFHLLVLIAIIIWVYSQQSPAEEMAYSLQFIRLLKC